MARKRIFRFIVGELTLMYEQRLFDGLCNKIIELVEESSLKQESYINAFLYVKDQLFIAYKKITSGYVFGEIKLAITLRLL